MQFYRMMHRDSQNVLAQTYWIPGVQWRVKYCSKEDSASLRISALLLAVWPPALENTKDSNRFWAPNPTLIYWWPHGFQEYYTDLLGIHFSLHPFFHWINLMIDPSREATKVTSHRLLTVSWKMLPENRNLIFPKLSVQQLTTWIYKMIRLMLNQHAYQNLNLGLTMQFFQCYGPCLIYLWYFSFGNSFTVPPQTKPNQKNQYLYFII